MDSSTTNYNDSPPSTPYVQFPFVRLLLQQLKQCQRTSNSISVRSLRRRRARAQAQPLEPVHKGNVQLSVSLALFN